MSAAVALFVVIRWRDLADKFLGISISSMLDVWMKWLGYTDCTPVSSPADDVCIFGVNLKHLFLVCNSVCRVGLCCATYAVLVLMPVYIILSVYCGTHTYEYIWSGSIVLLEGYTALVVEFVLLFTLGVVFMCMYLLYLEPVAQTPSSRAIKTATLSVLAEEPQSVAASTTVYPHWHNGTTMCFLLVTINFTVVAAVNVCYVFLKLNTTPSFQLTISAFKVGWNGVVSPMLSRYYLRPSSDHNTLELLVALTNTIVIPILAVVFVSPDCFLM